jgi:hypothetical protein
MSDRLSQLLRDADPPAGPVRGNPADVAAEVVAGVRRRAALRQRRRIIAGSAVGAAIVVILLLLTAWQPTRELGRPLIAVAPAPADPAQPQTRVAAPLGALSPQTAALLHERTVEHLTARSNARPRRRGVLDDDPLAGASPREQRDRAALILVYDADEQLRASRPGDAVAMYRRAIELFPRSPWANVARQRLKQIEQT